MNIKKIKILFSLCFFITLTSNAQRDLKAEINHILETKNAKVGVSIVSTGSKDTLKINNTFHYPLQSIFKFPIALTVLSQVDEGKLTLDQEIEITKKELAADTWSPIKDKFPDGANLTIEELLIYTVAQSDNIGGDVLLRTIGGTHTVERFLKAHSINEISIKVNEEQMHQNWDAQFKNWATPTALTTLLIKAYTNENQMLSQKSHDLIWKIMRETTTGTKRIKGDLPHEIVVAHKTGTSGTNNGITAATNDIGVIEIPYGQVIYISVLVANSDEPLETNEQIIAEISKAAYDYYTN